MNGNPNLQIAVSCHGNNHEDEESQVTTSTSSPSNKFALWPIPCFSTVNSPSYHLYSSSSVKLYHDDYEKHNVSSLKFRSVLPRDREQIEQLHLEWFPVVYRSDFFDSLVYGHMAHSDEPLFTHLAVRDDGSCDEKIEACVVGSFVDARVLSESTRTTLIHCVAIHPRLFYVMTVGTNIRGYGLGSYMIQKCIEQVERDPQCGTLYLHVLTDNYAAIAMYEKLGFYKVQEIPNYYKIDNELRACYLYAKYFHGNRGHRASLKLFHHFIRRFWKILLTKLTPFSLLLSFSWNQTTAAGTASNSLPLNNKMKTKNNNCCIRAPLQT